MRTIKQQWEQVIGPAAERLPPAVLEQRRALFYMGHASMIALIRHAASLPEEEGKQAYAAWNQEVDQFNQAMQAMIDDPTFGTTKKEETPDDRT